ncbi:MAG: class I SAM-dependent methyltransferase [Verrucomicrobiaceae bacterium]
MIEPEDISTLSHETRFPVALPTAVRWSHALLAPRLHAGDVVIDATAGNGHDTLFLARHVLPGGKVFAFDLQAAALEKTRTRTEGCEGVVLIHAGHERMEEFLPRELHGGIRAFMFNLGWLPGSDKACTTRADTTLEALNKAVQWLAEGGMITVVCYPGHEDGNTEADAVEAWAALLPADSFEAQKIAFLNLDGAPPRCVVLRKRARLTARTFG